MRFAENGATAYTSPTHALSKRLKDVRDRSTQSQQFTGRLALDTVGGYALRARSSAWQGNPGSQNVRFIIKPYDLAISTVWSAAAHKHRTAD
jgi:hypothetical protein